MSSAPKYKRPVMVNWYSATQLAATGLKALISGEFGHYADKRELQAALCSDCDIYRFDEEEELWIDFVSDTGDGFNSTYSIAKLVSEKNLKLALKKENDHVNSHEADHDYYKGIVTQPGSVLVMGGDQVYPTPEMSEYENRFKVPFRAANPDSRSPHEKDHPKMFAIPGNHDWYDGLNNFIKLFCQGRRIGNWHTVQKRSYFAIKLPYNYWLWGTDVQLNSDIDQPQKDYFQRVARDFMKDGDRVILCTAEPAWVYRQLSDKNESYKRLKYFEQLYITDDAYDLIGYKFKLVATLTGDLHHYSRYEEMKEGGYINQLITAGGGGAFLHPTHFLPESLSKLADEKFTFQKSGVKKDVPTLKARFPSQKQSANLSWWNFIFPYLNKQFTVFLIIAQLMLSWILQGTTLSYKSGSFIEQVAASANCLGFLQIVGETLVRNPLFDLISAVFIFGAMSFTDSSRIKRLNWFLGLPHGILQWLNMLFFMWIFAKMFSGLFTSAGDHIFPIILVSGCSAIFGGIAGAFIFGIYLWFSVYVLHVHANEGYSSLACEDYKNFIRIHITKNEVRIYPVGIEKVTKRWVQSGEGENLKFDGPLPHCHLIEKPIIIKNNES